MMKQMLQRGFTLIELLVVIAIIGILAAVVIGSLNDARQGGQNASIQQTMTNLRSQAELWYNNAGNYSYSNMCNDPSASTPGSQPVTNGIIAALDVVNAPAANINRGSANGTAANSATTESSREAHCNSNANSYQVTVPLADGVNFWCVDATGFSGQIATVPDAADTTCS